MTPTPPRRMAPVIIDIPEKKLAAAQIVIDAVLEAGLDPRKATEIPIVPSMVWMWLRGEMTRAEFVSNCAKLLIMNPTCAADQNRR